MLRYYQALFDITQYCSPLGGERQPTKVYERVLFTPDEGVYYCSATRMLDIHPLDYVYEWEGEEDEDFITEFDEYEHSSGPLQWGSVVKEYETGSITFHEQGPLTQIAYQGEYDNLEDAREYAQGNHLV